MKCFFLTYDNNTAMIPAPSYKSIDAPSVNWCGVHAIAYALYNEQLLAQSGANTQSHLYEIFQTAPLRARITPLSNEQLLQEALLAAGHNPDQITAISQDIRKIITDSRNRGTMSLAEIFQHYQESENALTVQRLFENYDFSIKALLGQRAHAEIVTKLIYRWTQLGIDQDIQQQLIAEHSEIIATLREIIVFFDRKRHGEILQPLRAENIQRQLSPLIYHLYQKLAILPQEQDSLINHRHLLSAIFGTIELANNFTDAVSCQTTVPSARAPEHLLIYQEDLRQRFGLLQEALQSDRVSHISIHVPNTGIIKIPCEPTYTNRSNLNAFKLSAQMTHDIARLLFKNDSLPEINTHDLFFAHDFDIFGGHTRYIIKSDAQHLKLLIRNSDNPNIAQDFLEENGFTTNNAPSGLSYFFGSFVSTAQTLLKLAALLFAIYVFIKVCFSGSSSKATQIPVTTKRLTPQQPIKSDYAPINIRGVLAPQKNLKFQKPKPHIPATLSRREQGRTYRK